MIDEKKIEKAAHFATDTSNLIEVSRKIDMSEERNKKGTYPPSYLERQFDFYQKQIEFYQAKLDETASIMKRFIEGEFDDSINRYM